jgi:hypothetical protein
MQNNPNEISSIVNHMNIKITDFDQGSTKTTQTCTYTVGYFVVPPEELIYCMALQLNEPHKSEILKQIKDDYSGPGKHLV